MVDTILSFLSGLSGLPILIGLVFLIVIVFLSVRAVMGWLIKVAPNEAYIIYGWNKKSRVEIIKRAKIKEAKPAQGAERSSPTEYTTETVPSQVNFAIVKGGAAFVLPAIQEYQVLPLDIQTLDVQAKHVLSTEAVPITVDGVAQIKIGGDDSHIATAAEQLLGLAHGRNERGVQQQPLLQRVAQETLTGHLRAIIGTMTVEQVYKDREAFSRAVLEVAVPDLAKMGFEIVSFVIKDISDPNGYLDALGRPEIEAKISKARIAAAVRDQEAFTAEQSAEVTKAQASRDTNIKKAGFDAEVNTEKARADAAGPISSAQQDKVLEEHRTAAAEQAAQRANRELDASVRFPADANRHKVEQEAVAKKATAEADATYTLQTGTAAAEVTGLQLLKTAEGQKQLAGAYSEYGPEGLRIVLGQALIDALPAIVDSASKPISAIKDLRVYDFGGSADGSTPLDKISTQGLRQTMKLLASAEALFGLPLEKILQQVAAKYSSGSGLGSEKIEADTPPAGGEEKDLSVTEDAESPEQEAAASETQAPEIKSRQKKR